MRNIEERERLQKNALQVQHTLNSAFRMAGARLLNSHGVLHQKIKMSNGLRWYGWERRSLEDLQEVVPEALLRFIEDLRKHLPGITFEIDRHCYKRIPIRAATGAGAFLFYAYKGYEGYVGLASDSEYGPFTY